MLAYSWVTAGTVTALPMLAMMHLVGVSCVRTCVGPSYYAVRRICVNVLKVRGLQGLRAGVTSRLKVRCSTS